MFIEDVALIGLSMDSLCKISNGNDTRIGSSAVWVCIDGTSADTTF
jgi:hypothetical protein